MIGTALGHFQITARIGAGGMGEVYRARDTRLDREVAIKVLPAAFASDPERLRRFEREARATAALSHPNILAIHDIGSHEGVPYLVEELLEGESLEQRLARGPLTPNEAARITAEISKGLAAAHAKDIAHRDLKPANLFLTTDGLVKILDFGLAKLVERVPIDEAQTLTETPTAATGIGQMLGTVAYMAPEQARGLPVDQRADIFAAGVVLFEMLAGERPFRGETHTDTIVCILKDDPPRLPASVPSALAAVVTRCLAKEPGQRYQDGAELRAALEAALSTPSLGSAASRRQAAGSRAASGSERIQSLVVLPLLDLSRDAEQEYFADGMTEALIADLAKIGALRVISRTSAMRYKSTDKSVPEIAAELGVDAVVEGSVLRAGERVRITAQLIHAESDTHLWAESYDRDLTDVLVLQSEVARAVAAEIRVAVTPEEERRLASARPVNSEAYDACLKGRFHWRRLSREHLETALRYFELALQKDPECARAWAGIASTWAALADSGFAPPHETIPKAKAAALRALELDDSLAEVRVHLANLAFCVDWNWAGAEAEFRRAIELDPNSADARFFLADLLISTGRADEALVEAQRTLQLDPFSFFFQAFFGWYLVYLRRYDDAVTQLRKTLEMEPGFSSAHLGLWGAFYRKGTLDDALAEAKRFFEVLGDTEIVVALEEGRASSGYSGAMGLAAQRLVERAARVHVPAVRVARLWAHAGEVGHAIEWLERALAWHESPLVHLAVGWDWDTLRSEPRFQAILHRIGLPVQRPA